MAFVVDPKRCPQNYRCPLLKVCPMDAITQSGNGLPEINARECIECGRCERMCAMGAVHYETGNGKTV